MRSRGGRAEESNPTEIQIQSSREEEVLDKKTESLPHADDFKPDNESTDSATK